MIGIFEAVASENGGSFAEILVATNVELVGTDVVAPGTQIVISSGGDRLLEGLICELRGRVRVKGQKWCRTRIDGHHIVRVCAASERVDEGLCGFLRKVALLHPHGRYPCLQYVRLWIAQALVITKNEGAVATIVKMRNDYRAAKAGTKVIGYLVRLISPVGAIGSGIQKLIL